MVLNLLMVELGYEWENEPEILLVDVPLQHASVAKGESPFIGAYWSPNQDAIFKEAGGTRERSPDAKMFVAGTAVQFAIQGYQIDKKTAEAHNIKSLADFKRPEIAKLFDSDGDDKADLLGCIPGWACADQINHAIEAYGLEDTVTHHQSPYFVMFADLMARYKRGESIFLYTWTPQWTHGVLLWDEDVVWLTVPFSSWHTDTSLDTTLPDTRDLGWPYNDVLVSINTKFAEDNPAAVKLIERFNVPIEDWNQAISTAQEGGEEMEDYYQLAKEWIEKNRATVDGWLAEARKAAQ